MTPTADLAAPIAAPAEPLPGPSPRVEAIDWLRGLVMVLMALDHVRFFFSEARFPPEDAGRTWLALFLTRWVTHLCAPGFFLLAGMSAWLSSRRGGVARHLVLRGALLVVLELTIIGFGWNFTPGYSFAGVIWALGWSMTALALLSRLPAGWLAALSVAVIAGHDLTNGLDPRSFGPLEPVWRFLHVPGGVAVAGREWFILYALVPWLALMSLGYAMGGLWRLEPARRQRIFGAAGTTAFALFVVLRATNSYGNPVGTFGARLPFRSGESWDQTLISLLNVSKYPGSLQFMLMTIGLCLVALAVADRRFQTPAPAALSRVILTFGRVPLFYYVLHLYLIHLLALGAAWLSGQPSGWLGWHGAPDPPASGYGYDLTVVYAVTFLTVALLYVPCRWFEAVKRTRRQAWMRYL